MEKGHTYGVVYEIPCHNCELKYIDETGRKLNTRLSERQKDVKQMYHRYTPGQSKNYLTHVLTKVQ